MKEKYLFIMCAVYGFSAFHCIKSLSPRFVDNMQEFETILTYTQKPLFVLFSASWCCVCNTFKETFSTLAKNPLFEDNIMFITVDFDKAKTVCDKYKVDRIPTFLYLQDGEIKRTDIGIKRGVDVKQFFEKTLAETFNLENSTQKTAFDNQSTVKSTIAYFAVPPLRYIKNGIEWCIQKLST